MMVPEEVWRGKSDEELVAASLRLEDYTDVGQQVIVAELERRRASGLMAESENVLSRTGYSLHDHDSVVDVPTSALKRLWRGHVSLPVTYWVYGIVVSFLLLIATALAEAMGVAILTVLLLLLSVVYYVYISVAIWRSAGRYRGRTIWAHLARISVAAGVARVVVNVIATVVGAA